MEESTKTDYSAVIITRNEALHIGQCINAILPITNDIIVVDSGSTDDTILIAKSLGARVFSYDWKGYGQNKNFGIQKAKHSWILSIDGDEIIDDELRQALIRLKPEPLTIYKMNSLVRYEDRWIRHSGWYPVWKNRLHHKEMAHWNHSPVHEDLISTEKVQFHKLDGHLLHYSYSSRKEHREKIENYAKLQAKKWIKHKRNITSVRRLFGPMFQFVKTYFLQLGFLDGRAGYDIATMNAVLERRKVFYYDQYKNQS